MLNNLPLTFDGGDGWDIATHNSYLGLQSCAAKFKAAYPDADGTIWADETFDEQGQSCLTLATGGTPGSTNVNLWMISASAMARKIVPSGEIYDPPPGWTNGLIPYTNIIAGVFGRLDEDGNAYMLLPDNATVDITPYAAGNDYYTFNDPPQKLSPHITANGLDLSTNTPDFCVGQAIKFDVAGLPYYYDAVVTWTLPGTFVNEKTNPVCDLFYDENASLLNSDLKQSGTLSTSCWYVSGETNATVTVDVAIVYKSGHTNLLPSITGSFNVHRPHIAHFDMPSAEDGAPVVRAGHRLLGLWNQDMSFGHLMHSDFPGVAGYTQVIEGEISISSTGGTSPYLQSGVDSLDNKELPLGTTPISPNGEPVFRDSPNVGLGTGNLLYNNYNDKFINVNYNTYLMFKPDGVGNIFVPLQLVTWNINATAHYSTSWTVVSGNPVADPTSVDCTSFPLWTNVFSNWGN